MATAVQSAASKAQNGASNITSMNTEGTTSSATNNINASNGQTPDDESEGTQKWNAMTDAQKQAAFDRLPEEQKQGKSYYEWMKDGYHHQKENWMPWIEDQYLRWFTRDNKASYATKDTLAKTKVTGIDQVDTAQDGVSNLVGSQLGQGGVLQPVGDAVSKEGVNRAERGGKEDNGGYGNAVMSGASTVGNSVWSGAKSTGSYVGGMMGGKKNQEEEGQ